MLEIGELLKCDNFFLRAHRVLLAWQRVVRLVSQHDFVEYFGCVVDKCDLVRNNVEKYDVAQVDS